MTFIFISVSILFVFVFVVCVCDFLNKTTYLLFSFFGEMQVFFFYSFWILFIFNEERLIFVFSKTKNARVFLFLLVVFVSVCRMCCVGFLKRE